VAIPSHLLGTNLRVLQGAIGTGSTLASARQSNAASPPRAHPKLSPDGTLFWNETVIHPFATDPVASLTTSLSPRRQRTTEERGAHQSGLPPLAA